MKAAYRKLAMQYHPDRNPGDADAAGRMAQINEAYEAVTKGRAWCGAAGTYVFGIFIVVAIAGAGKTKALAMRLAAETFAKVVVAAPTIALVEEIGDWLTRFQASVPVATIHSDQSDRMVAERVRKWFEHQDEKPDPRGGILLCSHAAVLDMRPPANARYFDLVLDEVPDVFDFGSRQFVRGHWWITRFLRADQYRPGVLRLRPIDVGGPAYERLTHIARNWPPDELDAVFQKLAAAILDPHRWVLVLEDQWLDLVTPYSPSVFGGQLDVLTILHPDRFKQWRSVTLMGARADRTMAHLLWSRLFNQRFSQHPLQRGLPARHTNGQRLIVRYFWQDRATRAMLAKNAKGGGTMQSAMCRTVAEHFGSRPFLWTLPRPRDAGGVKDRFWKGGGTAFDPKLRLPGRSFGLNDWRNYVNVALLSVINLSGEQLRLLALLGLNKEAVFDAMTATILYQDLLRSSLRVSADTGIVECVVPCLPSAKALADEFEGCKVEKMPADLIPELAGRQHGPAPSGSAMSDAERQRRHRARMREEQERHRQAAKEAA